MAQWKVSPADKKSIEEHELWEKDGIAIRRITGWRSGTWIVTTSDNNPPEFERTNVPFGSPDEDSIDMNYCCDNNIEEVEMEETWDGWYSNVVWPDDMDDEEIERLEELWDEDEYSAWEEDGWIQTDTEMWVWGDLNIEKIEE